MPDSPELELAKIALGVARESVLKQQADIRDLRAGAAAMLTGAAVVVSFLGGRAVDVHRFPLLVAAGVVFFLCSIVAIMVVLIPARRLGIKEIANGSVLLELDLDPESPTVDASVRLTQTYDEIYDQNDGPKRRLVGCLVMAAVLLVLQIGAWGLTIVLAQAAAPPAPSSSPAASAAAATAPAGRAGPG
ncbi:MAG: hypothetical protein QOE27_2854 [Solirubrobacteraceae bacterium]|jgi:hypothetical protein|nr:hypothetical protein [Solirubrobacteraceae bacterium]